MQPIIAEETGIETFQALISLKPVYALTVGCRTLYEKFIHAAAGCTPLTWHMRSRIAPLWAEQHPGHTINQATESDLLLINGRILADADGIRQLLDEPPPPGTICMQEGAFIAARLTATQLCGHGNTQLPELIDTSQLHPQLRTEHRTGYRLLNGIWELIAAHPDELRRDAETLPLGLHEGERHPSVIMVNPGAIHIGAGARIHPGAILDATEGFISIGAGATVEHQALLANNIVLAPHARIRATARIYSNVSIGSQSKIGGEVEDSIIEACANKQHDGFLGHSYLSSWCNLGAGTTTSDLRNNYSLIKLRIGTKQYETGMQFLGLLIGEHAKSAINTSFNTGTIAGMASNIFGSGFPPRQIPPFSWGGSDHAEPCDTDKATETARTVMARRGITMTKHYETLFRLAASLETSRHITT